LKDLSAINQKLFKVKGGNIEKPDLKLESVFNMHPELVLILQKLKASIFQIYPNAEEKESGFNSPILAVRIPHKLLLPTSETNQELPKGYCYIGGTFRSGLLHILGYKGIIPRDLDIASLAKNNQENITTTSQEFMPEDSSNGYLAKATNAYVQLSEQDFSINAGFVTSNFFIATPECITDTFNGTIRLTKFEINRISNGYGNSGRLANRALRFYTIFEEILGEAEMKDLPNKMR
jgi:hypothetical protein